ncbi:hypothetical protein J6590_002563 [Homalodisca vitripennis]|nr:hypothetical protein J6590_002563 [Homalodisca vitripennis]
MHEELKLGVLVTSIIEDLALYNRKAWGLTVNPTNAVVVAFTRRRQLDDIRPFLLRGSSFELKSEVKYLGVFLDRVIN